VNDADKIGLLAPVVGVQKYRVLHDIGIDLALEHGVVGLKPRGEFDVADPIALFLQLGGNADLELVDIGAWNETDPEFGLGRLLGVGARTRKGADDQESRQEQVPRNLHGCLWKLDDSGRRAGAMSAKRGRRMSGKSDGHAIA
jgi:hypothetical protein